jgi:hypothetical protein
MEKINNLEVKPFINKKKQKNILHKDLINIPYWCALLCGKKGSGKTSVWGNLILQSAIPKFTIVRIFSTTLQTDETMINIFKSLDKNKIEYELYDSLYDNNKENILSKQFNEIQNEVQELSKSIEKSIISSIFYIYVIDDMSDVMRSKELGKFITRHRHIKSCICLSSQYYYHFSPEIRYNLNLLLIFGDIGLDTLKQIYNEKVNSKSLTFENFLQLYEDITNIKYNFMYINSDHLEIRKNFNYKINI